MGVVVKISNVHHSGCFQNVLFSLNTRTNKTELSATLFYSDIVSPCDIDVCIKEAVHVKKMLNKIVSNLIAFAMVRL